MTKTPIKDSGLKEKKIDKKRSIGAAAAELEIQTHVIRFWESKFPQIKPELGAGNRRYYFDKDIEILKNIKYFLYEEGYTIAGLQALLKKRKKDNSKEGRIDFITETENKEDSAKCKQDLFSNIQNSDSKKPDFQIEDFIDKKNCQINLTNNPLSEDSIQKINELISKIEEELNSFNQILFPNSKI